MHNAVGSNDHTTPARSSSWSAVRRANSGTWTWGASSDSMRQPLIKYCQDFAKSTSIQEEGVLCLIRTQPEYLAWSGLNGVQFWVNLEILIWGAKFTFASNLKHKHTFMDNRRSKEATFGHLFHQTDASTSPSCPMIITTSNKTVLTEDRYLPACDRKLDKHANVNLLIWFQCFPIKKFREKGKIMLSTKD